MKKAWASALASVAVTVSVHTIVSDHIGTNFVLAQSSGESGEVLTDARRQQLQSQLDQLEREINQQQTLLSSQQKQSVSLERDVAILNTKIKGAQLAIKATNIKIQQLGTQITKKNQAIGALTKKLDREKQSLGQIIRATHEIDAYSLPEMALSNKDLSSFFQDLDSFTAIEEALKDSYAAIVGTRQQTEIEKGDLEDRRQQEVELKQLQEAQRQSIAKDEAEKSRILKASKGQEKAYQQIIASKQKSASEIRAALFQLRGSAAIPFGKAYDYAKVVHQQTGVRPAFLLGIIAEESNLGQNVGTGNWNDDMHPTRDKPVFAQITASLGLDPNKMPVSKKAWYGWGGAMGPAQFIPSTWVLYTKKVAALTGHNPPNPWEPQDAFMASGLLLKDNGALTNERRAALCYLAGCKNASNPSYAFYANDVLALAEKYQGLINVLQQN